MSENFYTNIILKGDVDGSIEALSDSLMGLSTEEVLVNIIVLTFMFKLYI